MSTQASVTCPWHGRRLEFAGNLSEIRHSSGTPSELKCDNPSRLTLKSLLDGIAEHAGSVTKIVTAAGALKAAVMATLG
jgi:hypothetical protein